MMMEEEEEERGGASSPSEVTPPKEENRKCNHSNDDVTSCPTEAGPEIATETEQSAGEAPAIQKTHREYPAVMPHKPGSGLMVVHHDKNQEENGKCNHSDDDVTSCPTETGPEIATETEQGAPAVQKTHREYPAVTPHKPGSGLMVVHGNKNQASEKLQRVRKWSISTYKCTRQVLLEKMGRGSRTVDLDLEPRLELLADERWRYDQVTKLTQTLANQLAQLTLTQKTLGDAFADLSIKTPALHVEFGLNAEAQRFLSRSGETLSTAVHSFTTDMNTLINKTMEDTLVNVKQYEAARIEYDAYRCDLEELNMGPRDDGTLPKLEQAQSTFQIQRENYQKTRDDLSIKLKLLQENKVKVLNSQLLLLLGALASHSSCCHHFLQKNLQQAAELVHPSLDAPSWLEDTDLQATTTTTTKPPPQITTHRPELS